MLSMSMTHIHSFILMSTRESDIVGQRGPLNGGARERENRLRIVSILHCMHWVGASLSNDFVLGPVKALLMYK